MSYDEMQGVSNSAGPTSPLNGYHPSYDKKYLATLPPTPKKPGNSGRPKSREEPMTMPIPESLVSDAEIMRLKQNTKHLPFPTVLEILQDRGYDVDDTIRYCEDKVVPKMVCPISEQLIAASSCGLKRKKMSTVINHSPLYHRFFLKKHFKEETKHLVEFYQNNKKKLPVLSRSRHSKYADPDQVEYLKNLNAQYIIDIADQRKKDREESRITRAQKQKEGKIPKFPKKNVVIATQVDRPKRCKPKVDFYSPEPLITKHGNSIISAPKQPLVSSKQRAILPPIPEPRIQKTPKEAEQPKIMLPSPSPVQVRRKIPVTPPAKSVRQNVTSAMSEQKISTKCNALVEKTFQISKNVFQYETTDTSVAYTPFVTVQKVIGGQENMPSTSASTKENESTRESTRASSTTSSTSSSKKRITRSSNSDDLFTTGVDVLKRKKRDYERTFNGMFWKKGVPPPSPPAKKRKIAKPENKTENKEDGKAKKRKARKRLFGTHKHQYEKRKAFLYMKQMKVVGIPSVSGALIPVIDIANQPTTAPKPKTRPVRVKPTPVKQAPAPPPSPTPPPPTPPPPPQAPKSPSPVRERRVPTPENGMVPYGLHIEDEFGNPLFRRTPTPPPPPPSPPVFQEGRPKRFIQPKVFFGSRVQKRTQRYV